MYFDVKGPKAVSWLKIKEDPYSIQTSKTDNILNNCPTLVSEGMYRLIV